MIPVVLREVLRHEPAEAYHAAATRYLSSHRLADFRRCPLLYHRKQSGLVVEEDRPAYLLGRAAHTLILEGRAAFEGGYAVGGPINSRTGEPFGPATKAFAEWAVAQGKPVLSSEQAEQVERMRQGVLGHELAKQLLAGGIAEAVVRAEWHGVACQARLDWLSESPGAVIVDLKTCDQLDYFEADARRYGYAHQLAFYRAILATACRTDPRELSVHLVAVEKQEPFRCGVWRTGEDVLAIAQRENEEAVKRLLSCRQRDAWPTGYEQARVFDWL